MVEGGDSQEPDAPVDTDAVTAVTTRSPQEASASLGPVLKRYAILEPVGQGGMGRVLRAYDSTLEREVALKVVRTEMMDDEAQARLEREAQAMARLSHPGVVAVYDTQDSPEGVVLVMELVRGQNLRTWLRHKKRAWPQIVERFCEAGQGLVAAHAAGILHRDFKPSNVLVPTEGAAKVTDFGLAKAAGQGSAQPPSLGAEETILDVTLTRDGSVVGTPPYMAPEQHRSGVVVGPPADQYSFCISLWEALTGKLPFRESGEALLHEKLRGPPAWPERVTLPRPLVEALRRGLAPEPERRWPSMSALLAALAYDPARRRRRVRRAVGGLGLLAAGAGIVFGLGRATPQRCTGAAAQLDDVWDDARRAELEAAILGTDLAYASDVWSQIEPRLDGYAQGWASMYTETCEATTLRGEQSTQVMDLRMACLHRAKVQLRAVTDVLLAADASVVPRAHDVVGGLGSLDRCADAAALSAAVPPPGSEEAEAVEHVREVLLRAGALREAGRYAQARATIERAEAELDALSYAPIRSEVALERGRVLEALGEFEVAEDALRRALTTGARHHQWAVVQAGAIALLTVVGDLRALPEQGLRYRELAQGLARDDPKARARVFDSLGMVHHAQGKYDEAVAEHRQALALLEGVPGADELERAVMRSHLAAALFSRGQYVESEAEHREVLGLQQGVLGPKHPLVVTARANLASALYAQGKYDEAEVENRRILELRFEILGPDHPDLATSHNNLATTLNAQGKPAAAEQELRRALAVWERALGPDHPDVAAGRGNLANTLYRQGKYEDAEIEHRRSLSLLEEALGAEHPHVATAHNNIALTLSAQGKHEEAEAELRLALELRQTTLDAEHPRLAGTRMFLAGILLDQGRPDEALPLAEQAWDRLHRDDLPPDVRADASFTLARAHRDLGDESDRTRELGRQALDLYRQAGDAGAEDIAEVEAWLRRLP